VEGGATRLDLNKIQNYPGVVRAWRISSAYKTIARKSIGGFARARIGKG
jgi:hypothetical protein